MTYAVLSLLVTSSPPPPSPPSHALNTHDVFAYREDVRGRKQKQAQRRGGVGVGGGGDRASHVTTAAGITSPVTAGNKRRRDS
jgi:hypothetical protein